jgi:hypothetical protein
MMMGKYLMLAESKDIPGIEVGTCAEGSHIREGMQLSEEENMKVIFEEK